MARQIAPRFGEPRLSTLEARLGELEARVALLIEALRVLARGLEDSPIGEPLNGASAEAARRASALLISPARPPRI